MRWRLHQLEKERLELTTAHNQELCRLQAELARLRANVERGEAQRAELQYQLTASQRDAARAASLSRDKHALTERAAALQLTVEELQKVVDITRRARDEDQHALQQEVEERDRLIHNFSSENQRLHRLLQVRGRDLEAALAAERCVLQEARSDLELLRTRLRETEHAIGLERERAVAMETALGLERDRGGAMEHAMEHAMQR
ncbi:hypothetical protein PFLUV_G00171860 [Perca fluviatilis]|uniref:Uncharacterized protein n=2 Tax=Perca fluviatilis TaxID=8168 RepID=A0A6A5DZZ6_PERFL|nr:hypothetical protein PFLUV_G00171860 [Perca fluviatilis]